MTYVYFAFSSSSLDLKKNIQTSVLLYNKSRGYHSVRGRFWLIPPVENVIEGKAHARPHFPGAIIKVHNAPCDI